MLREVVPSATRLAVLGIPPQPVPVLRGEIEAAGRTLGISIIFVQPSGPSDFDRAHADAKEAGAARIIHPLDGATYVHRAVLAQAALKNKLPGIYWSADYVEDGGLMTYSINSAAQVRRAAAYVDRILRGAKPADLPVEQPARIELVINMKTAKALGITIPRSLLVRADRLIQ